MPPSGCCCPLLGTRGDLPGAGAMVGPEGRAGAGRLAAVLFCCCAGGGGGGRAGTGRLVTPPGGRAGAGPALPPKNWDWPVELDRLPALSGSTWGFREEPGKRKWTESPVITAEGDLAESVEPELSLDLESLLVVVLLLAPPDAERSSFWMMSSRLLSNPDAPCDWEKTGIERRLLLIG